MSFLDTFSAALPREICLDDLKILVAPERWQESPEQAAIQSLRRCGKFDTRDYLERYPDVEKGGIDPVQHFVEHGIQGNRYFNCLSEISFGQSKVRLAYQYFKDGNYEKALKLYEELAYKMGEKNFRVNISICKKKLSEKTSSNNYIVSLTTYTFRINYVYKSILSLLNQSINNYKIILYLDKDEFSLLDIPDNLNNLIGDKFRIKFCDNLGSLKKIYYALKEYPNNPIITADDDIIYGYDWLEKLTNAYENNSTYIYCHRCHRIKLNNYNIIEYRNWKQRHDFVSCSYLNFPTTGGGAIFPPHSLHQEIFNIYKYKEICFNRDDIWIWCMAVLNRTKICIVQNCDKDIKIIKEIKNHPQANPLWKHNVVGGLNDISIKNIQKYYPDIKNIIKTEIDESYPIVFICNNDYIKVLIVLITSIMKAKHRCSNYKLIFLLDRISPESKKLLYNLINKFCFEHEIIDCNTKNLDKYEINNGYCTSRPVSMLKFDLPNMLPKYNKILYLDCDIIVNKDISSLFKYNIDNYYLAAVLDSGTIYSKRNIKNYFNSGVMLMNLKKMRNENKTKQLYEMKKKISTKLMDQDIFNMVFDKNVLYIPIKYNMLYTNLMRATGKFTIDDINKKYITNYNDMNELLHDSHIIHFASKEKPWIYDNVTYSKEWYDIYKISILSSIPLMRKKYNNNI